MAEVTSHMTTTKRIALVAAVLAALAGCADDTDELRAKIAEVKSRPGGRIEPLPEVKPYETFAYAAQNERSPFEAGVPASVNAPGALRPDANRPREFLEQFSLDTLRMVGTLRLGGRNYGLVQTNDGLVHRVLPEIALRRGRLRQVRRPRRGQSRRRRHSRRQRDPIMPAIVR